MLAGNEYSIYKTVIQEVLHDSERLPSLPNITMKIRQEIGKDSATAESLAHLVSKDPSLSALLVKCASSPLFRRAVAPKTLVDVIGLLGFNQVSNLVMLHSVRSLYAMRNSKSKKLFGLTWKRLVVKTAVAMFLAKKLYYHPLDQVPMATLLTEVGSLSVLSAILETNEVPDQDTYIELCRHYSKSLGTILLKKWNVDPIFIEINRQSGLWEQQSGEELELIDIVNLAIYNTVLLTNKHPSLPPLQSLMAYQKLPLPLQELKSPHHLTFVYEHKQEIQEIIDSFV